MNMFNTQNLHALRMTVEKHGGFDDKYTVVYRQETDLGYAVKHKLVTQRTSQSWEDCLALHGIEPYQVDLVFDGHCKIVAE